jgi:hypothetical protein
MGREKQDPCVNCGQAFVPDRRNARHQCYCGAAACKAASKRASQAKWLAKNPDYHRGAEAVARVTGLATGAPGIQPPQACAACRVRDTRNLDVRARHLSAPLPAEAARPVKKSCNAPEIEADASPLQDFLNAQPTVLIGLIAHISDLPELRLRRPANRVIQKPYRRFLDLRHAGNGKRLLDNDAYILL